MEYPCYQDNNFALRIGEFICAENITQAHLFDLLQELYTPEFTDFQVEYWIPGRGWQVVC